MPLSQSLLFLGRTSPSWWQDKLPTLLTMQCQSTSPDLLGAYAAAT